MENVQVGSTHYGFGGYITKRRWSSYWHQLDEVIGLNPQSVLEVGAGSGVFRALARKYIPKVESLDIDPSLEPDYVGSVTELPFEDSSFDVVACFQMLEHLPYGKSMKGFAEIVRVAKGNIVISLPDVKRLRRFMLYLPFFRRVEFFIPKFRLRPKVHKFDGEHYWEINKRDYSLKKVTADLLSAGNIRLVKTYRVNEHTFHRFFVFEKMS